MIESMLQLSAVVEIIEPSCLVNKLYIDAFLAYSFPVVTWDNALFNAINEGFCCFLYNRAPDEFK